jgi:hypothetical protein
LPRIKNVSAIYGPNVLGGFMEPPVIFEINVKEAVTDNPIINAPTAVMNINLYRYDYRILYASIINLFYIENPYLTN